MEIDCSYWMIIFRDDFAHNLYGVVKSTACVFITDKCITLITTDKNTCWLVKNIFLQGLPSCPSTRLFVTSQSLSFTVLSGTSQTSWAANDANTLYTHIADWRFILRQHLLSSVTSPAVFGLLTSADSLLEGKQISVCEKSLPHRSCKGIYWCSLLTIFVGTLLY